MTMFIDALIIMSIFITSSSLSNLRQHKLSFWFINQLLNIEMLYNHYIALGIMIGMMFITLLSLLFLVNSLLLINYNPSMLSSIILKDEHFQAFLQSLGIMLHYGFGCWTGHYMLLRSLIASYSGDSVSEWMFHQSIILFNMLLSMQSLHIIKGSSIIATTSAYYPLVN